MLMSSDVSIKVENISKCFQIYDHPRDRLKQMLVPRFRRKFGLPTRDYYREFWALKDISFDVKRGETVGIIGRNGTGKSTLLQIVCGTLSPTMGSVKTEGRIAALLELGSGFNPDFTGRENVYLNGILLGLSKEQIDDSLDEILAFAEIGDFIDQPIKNYSSGMVVRLAFAVQATIIPEIFIVDEALAVGDEKFQRKCFARLEYLKSQGSSILFVSHSPSTILELCDRTLLLERGERLLYCPANEAIRAYQKLIYAPEDIQQKLIRKFRDADKKNVTSDLTHSSVSDKLTDNISFNDGITDSKETERSEPLNKSIEAYDPGLKPETTTVYPIQGAEISSIEILSMDMQTVNVLEPGKNYEFVVRGKFFENLTNVYFGIHIRTISGLEITGQRFPAAGDHLSLIEVGKFFKITFTFRMDLLPGVYFIGGGIWSANEPNCLHRILDARMIRVVPSKAAYSFGYSDMSHTNPVLEIF